MGPLPFRNFRIHPGGWVLSAGSFPGKKVDVNDEQVRFASSMNIVLGVWLIFSPFIIGYAGSTRALWDALIVGVAISVLAWYRTLRPTRSLLPSWINLLLGLWLAVSPFVLRMTSIDSAMRNDITIGIGVAFFAIVALALSTGARRA
jgi:hypothetical protein